jgi:hypothetical protein
MSDVIARQLSGIYAELIERRPFSDVARISLIDAPANGRVLALQILQCQSDDLILVSMMRRCWLIDQFGFRIDNEFKEFVAVNREDSVDYENNLACYPHIKFATNGCRVRFGMRLGYKWYNTLEAPIDSHGRFDAVKLETVI